MHKSLFLSILIILIILTGCNDISSSKDGFEDKAVEVDTILRGDSVKSGELIEIEYTLNEPEAALDKLVITVTDSTGNVINEQLIEDVHLTDRKSSLILDETTAEGVYSLRLDFYSNQELFYSDIREFFISSSNHSIRSINSYPPVLYPGSGGLFFADTDCTGEDCWLRWTLDGRIIAEGAASSGYQSIEIKAPDNEGVYDLSLEVFPFSPPPGGGFDFESVIKKDIPVYINTDQKTVVNEFHPSEEFFSLFHFRGNLLNSADISASGIEMLIPTGNPELAVRNGFFGYYLSPEAAFSSDVLMLPVNSGQLKGFAVMLSVYAFNLPVEALNLFEDELFYTGYADGSFEVSASLLADGRLKGTVNIGEHEFSLVSQASLLKENEYSSISLAVDPSDEDLKMTWFLNGTPDSSILYPADDETSAVWLDSMISESTAETRIFGGAGFEGLVDEVGVYKGAIDPMQFNRAMDLKYGKTLMYAQGFDGAPNGLIYNKDEAFIANSRLKIEPGSSVDFPPVYPGYEEVIFKIDLADSGTRQAEAVFYADSDEEGFINVDFSSGFESSDIEFSLIFSNDSVLLDKYGTQNIESGIAGDFSAVGYRIQNNDTEQILELESVIIIRKKINISEKKTESTDGYSKKEQSSVGINIRS